MDIMLAAANSPSIVLTVIFWVLLFLAIIAAIAPDSTSPYLGRGRWLIVLALIAILGWSCLGIK